MKYEETPKQKLTPKKTEDIFKNGLSKAISGDSVSTSWVIWQLVKKHKFALVSLYAIGLTAVWVFPPLPDLLFSLIGK